MTLRNALSAIFICVACLIFGEVFLGTPNKEPSSRLNVDPPCDRTGIAVGEDASSEFECAQGAPRRVHGAANASPRPPADDEIAISFQPFQGDGRTFLAYVKREDASVFLQGNIAYLQERRARAIEDLERELDLLFAEVFSDKNAAVDAYADWFFQWGQTWRILFEASLGGVSELTQGNIDLVLARMRRETELYLISGYSEHVLRPDERDPAIQAGVQKILERAEQDYQRMLSNLDERLIELIAEAGYVVEVDADTSVTTFIDWESASLAAPSSYGWNAAMAGMGSLSLIVAGQLAAPFIQQIVVQAMGPVVAEVLISAETILGATALGSFVPGVGNLVGLAVGIGADFLLNEGREILQREEFEADAMIAIDRTIVEWRNRLAPDLQYIIEEWFDQSQSSLLAIAGSNDL